MTKHKYPIVLLSYIDPSYYSGIYNAKTKEFSPTIVHIVGHVLRDDDKEIVIAHECFSDEESADDVRYVSVVPKVCLLSKEVLHEQD